MFRIYQILSTLLIPLIIFTINLGFKKLSNLYFIFFLICFQGFIGWYMVSSGLVDRVDVSHFRLSLHLVVAFIILSLIFWNYLKLCHFNLTKDKLNYYIPVVFLVLIFISFSSSVKLKLTILFSIIILFEFIIFLKPIK